MKNATLPAFFKLYTENLAGELQEKASGGAQPFISLGALRSLVFYLPPLEEQQRIVTKVEQLLKLCSKLKTRILESKIIQLYLTDAITEKAVV